MTRRYYSVLAIAWVIIALDEGTAFVATTSASVVAVPKTIDAPPAFRRVVRRSLHRSPQPFVLQNYNPPKTQSSYLKSNRNEDDDPNADANDSNMSQGNQAKGSKDEDPSSVTNCDNNEDNHDSAKKTMTKVLLNINFAFAYITMAVGGLLSVGLLLNIFGYGYQITPDGQLRIDTIQQLREENQFRREVQKSMKEYRQQQRGLLDETELLQKATRSVSE